MTESLSLKHNLCLSVFLFVLICVSLPFFVLAANQDQGINFFVDSTYDLKGRTEITALLSRITPNAYFYLDRDWFEDLDENMKGQVDNSLTSLEAEFKDKIYPTLTATFGSEWKPGIDQDERITILFHPMREQASGYFNSGDEYSRYLAPGSNQREMIYLNSNFIGKPLLKSFLAHELIHLITFNQKEKIQGVMEDVWLNEGRAEAAITLLGYDDVYQGSNLQRRVSAFLNNPSDSLTEWQGKEADYGVLNLFIQYLLDHYGNKILIESLHSKKIGIASINEALLKNGYKEDFSQIFTDWTIAVLVHNCQLAEKYCYKNENLKTFYITPTTNFLPFTGESVLAMTNYTKNWAGNWQRFTGGKGTLRIEFIGNPENKFLLPYAIQAINGNWDEVSFFQLNEFQRGEILAPGLRDKVGSVVIIPSIQTKTANFSSSEPSFSFFWEASTIRAAAKDEEEGLSSSPIRAAAKDEEEGLSSSPIEPAEKPSQNQSQTQNIQRLLEQIADLEKQLANLRVELSRLLGSEPPAKKELSSFSCQKFAKDLYYGMREEPEIFCLQEFLKNQGPAIYPEGLVTGNFLTLTQKAVKRYQAKKGIIQTGYFGPLTRAAVNSELGR